MFLQTELFLGTQKGSLTYATPIMIILSIIGLGFGLYYFFFITDPEEKAADGLAENGEETMEDDVRGE